MGSMSLGPPPSLLGVLASPRSPDNPPRPVPPSLRPSGGKVLKVLYTFLNNFVCLLSLGDSV